ncbi:MAG TPA: DUF6056 family protein [Pseudomonadales bacterium]|nr:DUF6056 family protein [Pseudomonadales bacterium]
MDASNPERRNRYVLLTAVAVISVAFLLLNSVVPRFADDFCRVSAFFSPVAVAGNVWHSWFSWSGRWPVMFLDYSLFSLGSAGLWLFDITNAVILGGSCYMAMHIALPRAHNDLAGKLCATVFFLFLLWFTPQRFGEVALWKTGAMQYFWGCMLAAAMLLPVVDHIIRQHNVLRSRFVRALWCVGCLLGGAWLENLSAAMIATWMLLLVIDFRQRRRLDKALATGLFCWTLGFISLIAAPGNFARARAVGYSTNPLERLIEIATQLPNHFSVGLASIGILFCIVLLLRGTPGIKPRIAMAASFALVGVLSFLAMVGAPAMSLVTRATFPFEFFMILATMSLFPYGILERSERRFIRELGIGLTIILGVAVTSDYVVVLNVYHRVSRQAAMRERILSEESRTNPGATIALPALYFTDRLNTGNGSITFGRFFARDITTNSHHWRNACYAKAHNVTAVELQRQH